MRRLLRARLEMRFVSSWHFNPSRIRHFYQGTRDPTLFAGHFENWYGLLAILVFIQLFLFYLFAQDFENTFFQVIFDIFISTFSAGDLRYNFNPICEHFSISIFPCLQEKLRRHDSHFFLVFYTCLKGNVYHFHFFI